MVRKLATILPTKTLREIGMVLFQSPLMFSLPLIGGVWLPSMYLEKEWNLSMTTKGAMAILQAIQNKFLRVLTRTSDPEYPTDKPGLT